MFESITLTLAALFVFAELMWYVWRLHERGWALLLGHLLPGVGLLCGVIALVAVAVGAAVAWTHGPDAAVRLVRRAPLLLILVIYMIFSAAIWMLSGRYDTAEAIAVRDAIGTTITSQPGWVGIGVIIGMVSVPPVPLRMLLPGTSFVLTLICATVLSLAEVILALFWLLRRFPVRGEGLVPLVSQVPAVAWGGVGGYILAASVYYVLATITNPR